MYVAKIKSKFINFVVDIPSVFSDLTHVYSIHEI